MATAYSYIRFSHPDQAKGDSLRRQETARDAWLAAHPGVVLDKQLRMRDEGRSAWRRKDWATYALAEFVEHIRAGTVKAGSYLLLENLDRLSREDVGTATELFLTLVNRGVVLVQLFPVVTEFRKPVNVQNLMFAIFELSRGNSESAMKSERVGAAWARKRREATTRVLTRKLPGWIAYNGGKLKLIPDRAKVVKRIFELALTGHGVHSIAVMLNADGVPTMGRKKFKGRPVTWNETVVYNLLKSRATYGEFQPSKGRGSDRKPDGEPVAGYYPAVIDRDTFMAVSSALRSRSKRGSGRRGTHINLFSGLLVDARTGGSLTYKHTGNRSSTLIPVGAKQGKDRVWSSFLVEPFEAGVLSKLSEVTVEDVQGDDSLGRKIEALAGRLSEIDAAVNVWAAKMENLAIADTVAAKLAELNTERKAKAEELAQARREAATPLSASWDSALSLFDLLKRDKSEETRIRFRAAFRRSIESVHCLFTSSDVARIAAVRVQFRGSDRIRNYLIAYKPGRSNRHLKRSGEWVAYSFADAGVGNGINLREPKDAEKLERFLSKLKFGDARKGRFRTASKSAPIPTSTNRSASDYPR